MTDQSETGNLTVGLDTDTFESTIRTLSSHLVPLERIPISRQFFTDAICPCRALYSCKYADPGTERVFFVFCFLWRCASGSQVRLLPGVWLHRWRELGRGLQAGCDATAPEQGAGSSLLQRGTHSPRPPHSKACKARP
eukprot:2809288-Pyramimonas_sp.AAC.1